MSKATTVSEYIAQAPLPARKMMKALRAAIKSAAPQATEMISYGMPFYEYRYHGYKGRLVYFGAFAKHVSVFIVPRTVPPALALKMKPYKAEKATLQFPLNTEIPVSLMKTLVKLRMKEIDAGA